MRYQIHAPQFDDELVEVDIPGLFSAPRVYQNNRLAHQHFSDKGRFVVKIDQQQFEIVVRLPLFEYTVKVYVDGQLTVLNQHQSVLAKSCVFLPLAVLAFCTIYTSLHWLLSIAMTLPFAVLASRALRLSPLSITRKAVLGTALLASGSVLVIGSYPYLQQTGLSPRAAKPVVSSVFYEVVVPDNLPLAYTRESVVELLETFRLTASFQALESELALLESPPDINTSIYQSRIPKQKRELWIIRFDMTTSELGTQNSQLFIDNLGASFETFLATVE